MNANKQDAGGLPSGMVMVQRIDAERLAMSICDEDSASERLSARRVLELCRAAPAGGDDYEARYATPERLAKPAATVKCDFCGVRPGELHAYDCTALDSAPAGSGEAEGLANAILDYVPFPSDPNFNVPLGWILASHPAFHHGRNVGERGLETLRVAKEIAALLRKLQQGAE